MGDLFLALGRRQERGPDIEGLPMYGHDPLSIIVLLALVGVGIAVVQYRWPTVGASIDVATKVLITLIGMLVFASGTTSGPTPGDTPRDTNQSPAVSSPAQSSSTALFRITRT
ncbi:hypothetical protein [Streptomyces sp. NPDC048428]|uniref:hypothetical protein n=1 Tax=Streptomyces sp. NPDC048428 TaxID=3154503 RepID=UPI0034479264